MGCDIHLHQEVKIFGKWHHYSERNVPRDYELFEKMAGVRGAPENAISIPRGLPDTATEMTVFAVDDYGIDGHSHSWLNSDEIFELETWLEEKINVRGMTFISDYWGYLFGNNWYGFKKYPDERPKGLEDIRFIFWFDN